MKINVKMIGGKALIDLMKKKEKEIEKEINTRIMKAVIKVEAAAKKNSPILTGRLRSSITHSVEGHVGKVGTNVEYAPHVEFGTEKRKANPYLYKALQANFDYIRKQLSKAVLHPLRRR